MLKRIVFVSFLVHGIMAEDELVPAAKQFVTMFPDYAMGGSNRPKNCDGSCTYVNRFQSIFVHNDKLTGEKNEYN